MGSLDDRIRIEQMARALALSAGVIWDHLDPYPGYLRGIWRAKATEDFSGRLVSRTTTDGCSNVNMSTAWSASCARTALSAARSQLPSLRSWR